MLQHECNNPQYEPVDEVFTLAEQKGGEAERRRSDVVRGGTEHDLISAVPVTVRVVYLGISRMVEIQVERTLSSAGILVDAFRGEDSTDDEDMLSAGGRCDLLIVRSDLAGKAKSRGLSDNASMSMVFVDASERSSTGEASISRRMLLVYGRHDLKRSILLWSQCVMGRSCRPGLHDGRVFRISSDEGGADHNQSSVASWLQAGVHIHATQPYAAMLGHEESDDLIARPLIAELIPSGCKRGRDAVATGKSTHLLRFSATDSREFTRLVVVSCLPGSGGGMARIDLVSRRDPPGSACGISVASLLNVEQFNVILNRVFSGIRGQDSDEERQNACLVQVELHERTSSVGDNTIESPLSVNVFARIDDHLAACLCSLVGGRGTIARLRTGGYGILFCRESDHDPGEFVRRAISDIRSEFSRLSDGRNWSVSIGVVNNPDGDAVDALWRSDVALHEARRRGAWCVAAYRRPASELSSRQLEQRLRGGIHRMICSRRMHFLYSPLVDLSSRNMCVHRAIPWLNLSGSTRPFLRNISRFMNDPDLAREFNEWTVKNAVRAADDEERAVAGLSKPCGSHLAIGLVYRGLSNEDMRAWVLEQVGEYLARGLGLVVEMDVEAVKQDEIIEFVEMVVRAGGAVAFTDWLPDSRIMAAMEGMPGVRYVLVPGSLVSHRENDEVRKVIRNALQWSERTGIPVGFPGVHTFECMRFILEAGGRLMEGDYIAPPDSRRITAVESLEMSAEVSGFDVTEVRA